MAKNNDIKTFVDLDALAQYLREQEKKAILIFAYNGTGKTRLSMAFKNLGKRDESRDTLYFNAFTEDLFSWDNDLENDNERVLRMNTASRFFNGLVELEMESRIKEFLHRYVDFEFKIDYERGAISFWREMQKNAEGDDEPVLIKVSRGEENIFIWCFFLAIAQLAIDRQDAYKWVQYIYIDDPISSLDENNAIAVAAHLAQTIKGQDQVKVVISSHHTLFFNVLYNEFKKQINKEKVLSCFLKKKNENKYELQKTNDTPCFYHVAMLKELHEVAKSGKLYTYHFNILRSIMEKTATFHGFNNFGDIIKGEQDDQDGMLYGRYVNLLSHGKYSLFEPVEMMEENKEIFRKILNDFMSKYHFSPDIFPKDETREANT
jgi:wobble nucleotide-excising tRNase